MKKLSIALILAISISLLAGSLALASSPPTFSYYGGNGYYFYPGYGGGSTGGYAGSYSNYSTGNWSSYGYGYYNGYTDPRFYRSGPVYYNYPAYRAGHYPSYPVYYPPYYSPYTGYPYYYW